MLMTILRKIRAALMWPLRKLRIFRDVTIVDPTEDASVDFRPGNPKFYPITVEVSFPPRTLEYDIDDAGNWIPSTFGAVNGSYQLNPGMTANHVSLGAHKVRVRAWSSTGSNTVSGDVDFTRNS
jgi:hypothetical protein